MRKLLFCSTAALALWGCSDGGGTTATVPTTVIIAPTPLSFDAIGATQKVHAAVLDQKGRPISNPTAAWASSSASVTVVSLGGDSAMATAAAPGTANITATVGSVTGTLTVPVQQVGTALQGIAGNGQVATPSSVLGTPLRVKLVDRLGIGIAGQTVAFTVTTGGGTLSAPSAVTGADGTAQVTWTLGAANGQQTVTASTGSLSTVFTATANVAAQGVVLPVRGGNEAVMIGTTVPTAATPAVKVVNASGNPVPGLQVTFTGGAGSTLTGANVVTDGNGIATVGSWMVNTIGPNSITATVNAAGYSNNGVVFTSYGCQGGGGTGYAITLCYTTPMTASQRAAFENAAARWGTVVTGDLANEVGTFAPSDCDDNTPGLHFNIDDLVIFASITTIDGVGQILGQAGPCFIRDASPQLSILGKMEFDIDDVANLETNSQFGNVILHEMGHVLGIGTLWSIFGVLQDPSGGTSLDTYYSGTNGIAGFDAIGGTAYTGGRKVPVENSGGAGTANSHWRESVLKNELMTGYLNGGSNPLSMLTVRSLQDLGYSVNTAVADPFSPTFSLRANVTGTSGQLKLNERIIHPRARVDRNGHRISLPAQ